jgi:hypothetical protein
MQDLADEAPNVNVRWTSPHARGIEAKQTTRGLHHGFVPTVSGMKIREVPGQLPCGEWRLWH